MNGKLLLKRLNERYVLLCEMINVKAQGLDLSDIDEDPKARRERERAAELAADEAVARELLKNTSLKPAANGTATDIASQQPRTKDEFDEYSKQVAAIITSHQQSPQYAMFIAGLAKAICEPLGSEDVKKVSSGLTTLMNEKLKAEKGSGGKAKKGKAKPSLVVGAAKSAAPKFDTQAYDEADDFDDFMVCTPSLFLCNETNLSSNTRGICILDVVLALVPSSWHFASCCWGVHGSGFNK